MKILLLLPLLLGLSVPAIAHNEANGGNPNFDDTLPSVGEEGEEGGAGVWTYTINNPHERLKE